MQFCLWLFYINVLDHMFYSTTFLFLLKQCAQKILHVRNRSTIWFFSSCSKIFVAKKAPCGAFTTPVRRDAGHFQFFTVISNAAVTILTHSLLPALVRFQVGEDVWSERKGWLWGRAGSPVLPHFCFLPVPPQGLVDTHSCKYRSLRSSGHFMPPAFTIQQCEFWNPLVRLSTLLFSWGE